MFEAALIVPDGNISTNVQCIGATFCTDRHGPQGMNAADFGDPLLFL